MQYLKQIQLPKTGFLKVFCQLLGLLFVINGCSKKEQAQIETDNINPAFAAFISGYSGALISTRANIRIQFTEPVPANLLNADLKPADLFNFKPALKGKITWPNSQTIQFTPDAPLPAGQAIVATFKLGKVFTIRARELQNFDFKFYTIQQDFFNVPGRFASQSNSDYSKQDYYGTLQFADAPFPEGVAKMISAEQNGRKLTVNLSSKPGTNQFGYLVKDIERGSSASEFTIHFEGVAVGAKRSITFTDTIPAIGTFCLLNAEQSQSEKNCFNLSFSDPLDANQNLNGLINLFPSDKSEQGAALNQKLKESPPRFAINGSEIRIYLNQTLLGNFRLGIEPGIKNTLGHLLSPVRQDIIWNNNSFKPELETNYPATIFSDSKGFMFPFKAKSLRSVIVQIDQIYNNNIIRKFETDNGYNSGELKMLSRPIVRKRVYLQTKSVANIKTWNAFNLDLSSLVKAEKGIYYVVNLSFNQEDAITDCNSEETQNILKQIPLETIDLNQLPDYDNLATNSNSETDYYLDYSERMANLDNPCHAAYFTSSDYYGDGNYNRFIRKSVLFSDLGLMAKKDVRGNFYISTNSLNTGNPLGNVTVKLYNRQKQVIAEGQTKADGTLIIAPKGIAEHISAEKGKDLANIRVDDYNMLPYSAFDVKGEEQTGKVQGYIFAERGVWRPGDSLFIGFIYKERGILNPPARPVIFELFNARAQRTERIIKTDAQNGFYVFKTATKESDETGYWRANISVGGSSFSKTIRIETVKPNRLRIKSEFGDLLTLDENNKIKGRLGAAWLFGAPATRLTFQVNAKIKKGSYNFPAFPNYTFMNPEEQLEGGIEKWAKGNLGNDGKIDLSISPENLENLPGILNAEIETQVFEPGGDISSDYQTLPFLTKKQYAGFKIPDLENSENNYLGTNTDHTVNMVSINNKGIPTHDTLKIDLYKLDWEWWGQVSDDNVQWFSQSNPVLVSSIKQASATGISKMNLNVKEEESGRYFIRITSMASGHSAGKVLYIYSNEWLSAGESNNFSPERLVLSADKKSYKVGETIKLKIPSSANSQLFVSLETGTEVLKQIRTKAKDGFTEVEFLATREMSANVYANVALIQPLKNLKNDRPIRMYGVINLPVENPNSHLKPLISTPAELAPNKTFSVKVSEKTGQAMTYSLAIVDEGLLDLTRFKTPDPWEAFNRRRALGIKTWDMYSLVGNDNLLSGRIAVAGGDGIAAPEGAGKKAQRFKPVVMFAGPFTVAKNGQKVHQFKMPNYVGSVRVMVVASNPESDGSAEKIVPVKQKVMLVATLPRVLAPNEKVRLPVNIFNETAITREAKIEVNLKGSVHLSSLPTQTIQVPANGNAIAWFDLKVGQSTGPIQVFVKAHSGADEIHTEIDVPVRNPNPKTTTVTSQFVPKGAEVSIPFEGVGQATGTIANIEVSSIPPINLAKRLAYLYEYPYPCAEQLVSGAFPYLYVGKISGADAEEQKKAQKQVEKALKALPRYEAPTGGLALYPSLTSPEPWISAYAIHFMTEAEKQGYTIPSELLQRLVTYSSNCVNSPTLLTGNKRNHFMASYMLYALSLAEHPETGIMNRLLSNPRLTEDARWPLSLAYSVLGQQEAANSLIKNRGYAVKPYFEMYETYGSEIRDEAIILMALVAQNSKDAQGMAQKIAESLNSEAYLSTQGISFALVAMSGYINKYGKGFPVHFAWSLNGGKSNNTASEGFMALVTTPSKAGSNTLKFKNTSAGQVYVKVTSSGYPTEGIKEDRKSGLDLVAKYTDLDGKAIDVTNLAQGTNFIARVTITNPGRKGTYANLALKHIFPSGWEIERSTTPGQIDKDCATPDFADVRDDRINYFLSLAPGAKKTFAVKITAAYAGTYYLPGPAAEAMYDESINASLKGNWVNVIPTNEKPAAGPAQARANP